MRSKTIADAWLPGGQSQAIRTVPGQVLKFVGGHAEIIQAKDIPHVLRMPTASIEFNPEYRDWIPDYIAACGLEKPVANWWIREDVPIAPDDGLDPLVFSNGVSNSQSEQVRTEVVVLGSPPATSDLLVVMDTQTKGQSESDRTDFSLGEAIKPHKAGCPCTRCVRARAKRQAVAV